MISGITILFIAAIIYIIKAGLGDTIAEIGASPEKRGMISERKLVGQLKNLGYSDDDIYHNLYIIKSNQHSTQIDLVLVTKVGLLVFEVKNYAGWIYGSGHKPYWTQTLNYGKVKNKFYNPIQQNQKHIDDLKQFCSATRGIPIFSVVVFYGESEFQEVNFIPENHYVIKPYRLNALIQTIISENTVLPDNYAIGIKQSLNQYQENGKSEFVRNKHVETVNNMLGKHRVFD